MCKYFKARRIPYFRRIFELPLAGDGGKTRLSISQNLRCSFFLLMFMLSAPLVAAANPDLQAWQDINGQLRENWREYLLSTQTNNRYLQENRLEKIKVWVEKYQFSHTPVLSLAFERHLRGLDATAEAAQASLPFDLDRRGTYVWYQLCDAGFSLKSLSACLAGMVQDFKHPVQSWWLPSQAALALFFGLQLSFFLFLVSVYLSYAPQIYSRWRIFFPTMSKAGASAGEVLLVLLFYLWGGLLGVGLLLWLTTALIMSKERLLKLRWLGLVALISPLLFYVPFHYHDRQKEVAPYLEPFQGALTYQNLSRIIDQPTSQLNTASQRARHLINGNQYMRLEKYAQAQQAYQEALAVDPNFVKAKLNLGLARYIANTAREDLDDLSQIQAPPSTQLAGLWAFNLSKIYFARADLDQAQSFRDRAKSAGEQLYFRWETRSKEMSPLAPFILADMEASDFPAPSFVSFLRNHSLPFIVSFYPGFGGILFFIFFGGVFLSSFFVVAFLPSEQEEEELQQAQAAQDLSFEDIMHRNENHFSGAVKALTYVIPGLGAYLKGYYGQTLFTWITLSTVTATLWASSARITHPYVLGLFWPILFLQVGILSAWIFINLMMRAGDK